MPTREEVQEFSELIEKLANKLRCSRMDAVLEHCKDTELEVEVAATLLSSATKAKIHEEAEDRNLIKKTARLPI